MPSWPLFSLLLIWYTIEKFTSTLHRKEETQCQKDRVDRHGKS